MTRIRNVRQTTKFKRSIKAISPVIATLLMIAIAVVASLVVYAWVSGYMGFQTAKTGKAIQIQSFAVANDGLHVYVQNVGQGALTLSTAYVNSTLQTFTADPNFADNVLPEGNTADIIVAGTYNANDKVNIKITTSDGTFMTTTGTVKSGSSNPTPTNGGGNTAPVLTAIGAKSVNEGALLSFTATATDTDTPAQTLTFSLQGSVPSGAAITGAGAFTWTPSSTQGSTTPYQITVRVTDNGAGALYDEETIAVTVNDVGSGNTAPVLTAIGAKSVNEGALLSFTATATDTDTPAQTLTFSLQGSVPSGAAITGAGAFTWTPSSTQGSTTPYQITVRVTDNGAGSLYDEEQIAVTVNDITATPVTDLRSPTSDFDVNGAWSAEENAYADAGGYGTSDNNNEQVTFSGYEFAVPSGATNIEVRVRLDAWDEGNDDIRLEVYDGSWHAYTPNPISLSTTQTTIWCVVTGLSSGGWTPSEVNGIQVRVTHVQDGMGTDDVYLDWIPIEVTYTP